MALIGAGWYQDPTGRHEHRYFDGYAWTDTVATGGLQSIDPLGLVVRAGGALPRRWLRVGGATVAIAGIVALGTFGLSGRNDHPEATNDAMEDALATAFAGQAAEALPEIETPATEPVRPDPIEIRRLLRDALGQSARGAGLTLAPGELDCLTDRLIEAIGGVDAIVELQSSYGSFERLPAESRQRFDRAETNAAMACGIAVTAGNPGS